MASSGHESLALLTLAFDGMRLTEEKGRRVDISAGRAKLVTVS